MFERIGAFQDNSMTLGLRRYRAGTLVLFNGRAPREENIRGMVENMRRQLGENDIAYIRVGLVAPGTADGQYGHALMVQRMPHDAFAIFDPNNGAFVYSNRRNMEDALHQYMDDAFDETGLRAIPDSVQYYTASASQPAGASSNVPATSGPPRVSTLPAPPLPSPQSESPTLQSYERSADASNGLSGNVLSTAAGATACDGRQRQRPDGIRATEHRTAPLAGSDGATENLRERLSDPARRQASIDEIGDLQEANSYAVIPDVPNRIRHAGASGMRAATIWSAICNSISAVCIPATTALEAIRTISRKSA